MTLRRRSVLAWSAAGFGLLLLVTAAFVAGSAQTGIPGTGAPYGLDSTMSEEAKVGGSVQVAPYGDSGVSELQLSPEAGDSARSSAAPPAVERMIVRQGSMELRVRRMDDALADLKAKASRSGAEIADLTVATGDTSSQSDPAISPEATPQGPSSATVTLRVAEDRLDPLMSEIAKIGTVVSQSLSSDDVTEQAIDLDARLRNLRAEEARLRSLFERAAKVSELLEVERELARVRGEIESLDAQLTYLKRQAARATLVVALTEPGPVVYPAGDSWGFREALTRGIQVTVALVSLLITLAIPLAVIALFVAAIVMPVRALLKRRHNRPTASDEVDPDVSEPDGADKVES